MVRTGRSVANENGGSRDVIKDLALGFEKVKAGPRTTDELGLSVVSDREAQWAATPERRARGSRSWRQWVARPGEDPNGTARL